MPIPNFRAINSLDQIQTFAEEEVTRAATPYLLNLQVAVSFPVTLVQTGGLADMHLTALEFMAKDCPRNRYMNHGSFYGGDDGISYMIKELREKANGNRAMLSLVGQNLLMDSGNDPVPSFLILQASIENRDLYVTLYFRALEVTRWLRLNIEETRLTVKRIVDEIPRIDRIHLVLHAFRAHRIPDCSLHEKPELMLLDSADLLLRLEKRPSEVVEMIRAASRPTTYVQVEPFEILERLLRSEADHIPASLKTPYILNLLTQAIGTGRRLIRRMELSSHDAATEEMMTTYLDLLRNLAQEMHNAIGVA